ncbi:MAG: plastocyanin/azurin family copper-binding protein [Balneolaceae bacterium]|nr:plastocyanin/azurin family copper-binding protein [Balneolaceae bacterium]
MMKNRTISIAIVTTFAALLLAAFHKAEPTGNTEAEVPAAPAATVGMTNTMKFTPDTVRISAGETVEWNNSSLLAHSVTGDPSQSTIQGSAQLPEGADPFDSGMMDPKETFRHTFNTPGTYQYFCIPHEGAKMYGWVIVE